MKKFLICLTLLVSTTSCLSEAEERTLHFPFGLSETLTFFQAIDKVESATNIEKHLLDSLDSQYLHCCFFGLDGKSFLGVPADYIRVDPIRDESLDVPSSIRSNDSEALFDSILISFQDDGRFDEALKTIYNNLCIEYGKPSSKSFRIKELSLNGVEYMHKEFPLDSADAMSILKKALNESNDFWLDANWNNVRLSLTKFKTCALTLEFFRTPTLF